MATPNDPPKKPAVPQRPAASGQPQKVDQQRAEQQRAAQQRAEQQRAEQQRAAGGKPVARPQQPGQQPGQPGARPAQAGAQQGARPGQPGARPAQPGAKPAQPGARPAQPGAKPGQSGAQQGAQPKPQAPGGKPAQPAAKKPDPAKRRPGGVPSKIGNVKPATPAAKENTTPQPADVAVQTGGRRLGQVLVDLGYIDEGQLWELIDEANNAGITVGQVAMSRGLITENQLMQALADQYGLPLLKNEEVKPIPEALGIVNEAMATSFKMLPINFRDGVLTVVTGDPATLSGIDDLRNLTGCTEVKACLALPSVVNEVMATAYQGQEESIMDIIQSLEEEDPSDRPVGRESSIDLESLMEMQDAAPVRKLLNMVMLLAIKDRASDIHFEPFEDEYKMRYRCDGVLYEMVPPPRHLAAAIATRIKVMSNLDIAERRLPQDGRIELNVGGNAVDMRVSVLPTMFGESVVIRVLDRGNVGLDLNRLGMEAAILEPLRELIRKPNGIILVTGPTGSGKTTTLYSCLNELNEITDKIITTEDPVEYDIDGIIQVPINADIDVTFASALRAILRQDPDRILVGEIRDLETAQIAVQSALTGHMVFSTLHTNDAPGTIARLRDMGLDTFLITATVEAVLAQRLVRKICEDCRTAFEPSPEILMELGLRPADVVGKEFFYGKGCDRCNNSGYKGRQGLYELLIMNDELRDMISSAASGDALSEACRRMGMITLRESGLRAIWNGGTTIDEVMHETITDDES